MGTRRWTCGALLGVLSLFLNGTIAMATVVSPPAAAQTVVIEGLTVNEGSVSGTVVNRTSATVGRIEVLVRQDWQWKNERHPGNDNPGRALPFTLGGDVAPNASAPFTFPTPRLPQRTDGRFVTTIDVVSFSEVRP